MDHVPDTEEESRDRHGLPKPARGTLSSVFAFASAFGVAFFFGKGDYEASAAVFLASAVVMTVILCHQKNPVFSVVPFVLGVTAAAVPGVGFLPAVIALSAVLVFSCAMSVMLIRRVERFFIFLLASAMLFAVYTGLLILILSGPEISVAASIEKLSSAASAAVAELIRIAGENGAELGSIDPEMLANSVIELIPAAIMTVSMILSLIFTALFGLAARIAGTKELFKSGGFVVPRLFAAIYLLLTVFSFVSGYIPDPWSYMIINLDYVLMAIFIVVGIRELFRSPVIFKTGGRFIIVLLIAGTVALFFGGSIISTAIAIALPVLSYVGAFRSLRRPGDKGSKKNEE